MQSLRETLSSAFNERLLFSANNPFEPPIASRTPSSTSQSGDESLEAAQAIPNSLIIEEWQLILQQDASVGELQSAIDKCKQLICDAEEFSTERRWLVRHLVELRYRMSELKDVENDQLAAGPRNQVILGHHFVTRKPVCLPARKQYCDHCSGVIWSVVQASYICEDCSFNVHHKCLLKVIRVCAHIVATEKQIPRFDICPEIGIAAQCYKCAECMTPIAHKGSWIDPRICDYSGLYYCMTCHWDDTLPIPARIIHNWDFLMKKICRASFQEITLLWDKPVIDLELHNPKLFVFVQKLSVARKVRNDLYNMKKYLSECRIAEELKIVDSQMSGSQRHLIQTPRLYSVSDMVAVENGSLIENLNKIFNVFEKHIRQCEICAAKGYLCEVCGNNEIIYPFDDGSVACIKCNSLYHRACWLRKNKICIKCNRVEARKAITVHTADDSV